MKKRILSITLVATLLLLIVPVSAFAKEENADAKTVSASADDTWSGFEEFSAAVSELLEDTMEDDYIAGISMEVNKPEMTVNGEVQPVVGDREVAPVTKDEEILLPVRSLAEQEGAEVFFDPHTNTATVQTEEGEIAFTPGEAEAVVSDGEEEALCAMSTEPELIDGTMYVPLDTVAGFLGYEAAIEENKVLLTKPYQTKRLIVKSGEEKLETYGAVKEISGFRDLHILQYETEAQARAAQEKLLLTEGVRYAEPDTVVSVAEHKSWGADYIGADAYCDHLQANTALDEVVVAVVDTGANSKHEFLQDRLIPTDKSFIEGWPTSNDLHGHGTHVSGIIVDCTPSNVKILPVKVLDMNGYGTELSVYNGLLFAIEQDCDVINMSLGGYGKRELEQEAVKEAVSQDISVVVAAGNESMDAGLTSPARLSEAITVGALDKKGLYAGYSNYGEIVDIWAPGSNILSSVPGNKYTEKSGTSMAAPHVAAVAAMLKTYDRTLVPRQVEGILKEYAIERDIGEPYHDGTSRVLSAASLCALEKDMITEAVETPVASQAGGQYQEELTLSLTCATPDAVIRYTLDGSDPADTGIVYTGPLLLQGSAWIRMQAFKPGCMDSYKAEEIYYVSQYPESFHYKDHTYYDTWTYTYPDENAKCLKVTFDEETYLPFPAPPESKLRSGPYFDARLWKYGLYLYDEEKQPVYNEFADVDRTHFIHDELRGKSVIIPGNSFSVKLNFPLTSSDYGFKIKSVEPLYEEQLSPPEFVTPSGNSYWPWNGFDEVMIMGPSELDYKENKTVTLRSAEGADIYYTLDGSIPTRDSLKYTGPILLDEPKRIRAKAFKSGYTESAAVSETYYSSKYPESLHSVKREYYFIDNWVWEAPPNVKYIAITFDEKTFLGEEGSPYALELEVFPDVEGFLGYDPTIFYGTELAGQTIYIEGNTFQINCGAYWPEGTDPVYGFKIADISYYYDEDDLIPIESIKVSGPGTVLVGEEGQMTAEITPANANTGFFWRKMQPSSLIRSECAEIDENGVVTGKMPGSVIVLATSKLVNSVRSPSSYPDWPNYSYNGMYKGVTIRENPGYAGNPTPAVLTKAPKAKPGLTYTGKAQILIEPGEAEGGTLLYSLSETGEYSTQLPADTDAGPHTVWYKVQGDEMHTDLSPAPLTVTIAKAARPEKQPENVSVSNGTELLSVPLPVGWSWKAPDGELAEGENTVTVVYWDTKNFVQTEFPITITMEPPPHVHDLTKTEAKPASCTEEGNRAYWTCSKCESIFADGEGMVETTLTQVVLEKLPHTPGNWQIVKPATETEEGLKQKKCTVCQSVLITEPIPWETSPVTPPGPVDPSPSVPEKLPFTDVQERAWYEDAVRHVYFNGLMMGTSETLFSPWDNTTRGMIVTILWRQEKKPEGIAEMTFADVKQGAYCYEAVRWAAEQEVVLGYSETTFAPDDPITRQDLATILYRYAGSPETDGSLSEFSDREQASGYAERALCWAAETGVLSGKGNGTLDPKGRCTRAEAAAMIQRYCEKVA